MTPAARHDGSAAGDGGGEQHSDEPLRMPLLVRLGRRWLCRHELGYESVSDGPGPDVQLRP